MVGLIVRLLLDPYVDHRALVIIYVPAVLAAAYGAWLARRVPPADLGQAPGWPDGPGWALASHRLMRLRDARR